MCKTMLENGIYGLHFYTLNQEATTKKILIGLGLVPAETDKPLPWFTVSILHQLLFIYFIFSIFMCSHKLIIDSQEEELKK